MSEESDRAQAIESGTTAILGLTADRGIEALLDAGWIPPKQRNEELRQMAEWQRDARRAFEDVEAVVVALEEAGHSPVVAHRLRGALGDRFSAPEKTT